MNSNQLIVILDSSVAQIKNKNIGCALCLWIAYPYNPDTDNHPISQRLDRQERYKNGILMEASCPKAIRCGSIYNSVDGPTRIFYDGIIRAMESCYYLLKKEKINEVYILGDCEHAIQQLNGKRKTQRMTPLYNQVKKKEQDYLTTGVNAVHYIYIRESDYSLYKKIDAIAKEMRNRISKMFVTANHNS